MSQQRTYFIATILFFISVIAMALLYQNSTISTLENFRIYAQMQENIIDREDFQRGLLKENLEIQAELDSLNQQLHELPSRKSGERSFYMDKPSPTDRIRDKEIKINYHSVYLNIQGAQQMYLLDTNSMDPLLDEGTTVLSVKPMASSDIRVGDIIIFRAPDGTVPIVHRVYEIAEDEKGLYFVTKGDNNQNVDTYKTRFKDIVAVVVGILY